MTRILILAAAALSLGACSTLSGGDPTSNLPASVLENLRHCKRTYQAAVGGFGVPGGSLYIECPAEPYAAPVVEDLG
jgi:hypothetical protein